MEEIKEVKPKKKRPRPEGERAKVSAGENVGERPKKKRPRPEGERTKVSAGESVSERPKKKRPRPEGERKVGEESAKKRPRPKNERVSEKVGEERVKKNPRPESQEASAVTTKKGGNRKKKKKGIGNIISTIVLLIALAVFAYSAFQLYQIFHGYSEGQNEYEEVIALAIEGNDKDENEFRVNFDELMNINSDTVGWIRFYPEPAQINYPVVQGPDNDIYLSKTFSANDNTVGAIFVNVYNNPDFNDKHTIVYGHRMNDDSMFHDLAKYADKSFWESNPYFYIYTPDGRKITYHIYAAGEVLETSESYLTVFADDEEYQNFLQLTKQEAAYDTGIDVETDDTVVTLSTCVKGKDEARFVVRGVKASEDNIGVAKTAE